MRFLGILLILCLILVFCKLSGFSFELFLVIMLTVKSINDTLDKED